MVIRVKNTVFPSVAAFCVSGSKISCVSGAGRGGRPRIRYIVRIFFASATALRADLKPRALKPEVKGKAVGYDGIAPSFIAEQADR